MDIMKKKSFEKKTDTQEHKLKQAC